MIGQVSDAGNVLDRYGPLPATTFMTGVQALVRVIIDQHRLDAAAGKKTATLVSGYEGSPLAGFDLELLRHHELLQAHHVEHRPAVNEELGATAVMGSQMASASPDRKFDGVVGVWYGKAPGLDRATDAIRHGNLAGADPNGGALALVGDDSIAKSSTVPSSSELAMVELGMPVLSPSDPTDILRLGLHGIAMSRFCGLWVGLKIATNVADGGARVDTGVGAIGTREPSRIVDGAEFRHAVNATLVQPHLDGLEQSLVTARRRLAIRYAQVNGINQVEGDPNASVGIVAAGGAYLDVGQALSRLSIEPTALQGTGVRLLKLGMVAPLEPRVVREFADGLSTIVVVEEKQPVIENALKDLFYGEPDAPQIFGRRGPDDEPLFRAYRDLPPELIARHLEAFVPDRVFSRSRRTDATEIQPQRGADGRTQLPLAVRTPYFCSGCPHNRSTEVPGNAWVGAGIGCSGLTTLMPQERVGEVIGLTQMGGEGVSWVGMAPFVHQDHLIQTLGDGTYHHSGSLAVRAAVASGARMTYKILLNSTVAMTGGQDIVGGLDLTSLVAQLRAEGVEQIVVTSDDPKRIKRLRLPRGVRVRPRDDLVAVQAELAEVDGVTVLIHEQECATEVRRKRKRGVAQTPKARAFINEQVCEGCGDCGAKSNCLSVRPVDTEFGRKTQIHQESCNLDFSCFDGDCPSFVAVIPADSEPDRARSAGPPVPDAPSQPPRLGSDGVNVRLAGIGGTGVVTAAQVLATAAVLDGLHVQSLDQLGMAQKGGAVVSDIRITKAESHRANKIDPGNCDVFLGADLLVAVEGRNLDVLAPDRTFAVVSLAKIPTGEMVTDISAEFPDAGGLTSLLRARIRDDSLFVDVHAAAARLVGSDQYANVLLIGAAFQSGALPMSGDAIEDALRLNGVRVEQNIAAFRWGRHLVADPADFARRSTPANEEDASPFLTTELVRDVVRTPDSNLLDLLERRADELVRYQNRKYAISYLERVEAVRSRLADVDRGDELVQTYAAMLFKLMAYKDEYEVARLCVDNALDRRIQETFGERARYSFRLQPPLLRVLGLRRKLSLDARIFRPVLRTLYALRFLRGTPFDPFGHTRLRRTERELIPEYVALVDEALGRLEPATFETVHAIVASPEAIRGYEDIKVRNVEECRRANADRIASLVSVEARPG